MQLLYLKGKQIQVKWTGTRDSTVFSPIGEVSDEFGKRLLENPRYKGWFKEIQPTVEWVCDICQSKMKSKAGLISHKRKHKEKQ